MVRKPQLWLFRLPPVSVHTRGCWLSRRSGCRSLSGILHPFQVGRDCTGSSSVRPLTTSFFAVRGASVGPLPRRAFGRQRWRETVFHPSPRVFSFLLSEAAACSGPHVRSSPLSFSSTSAGLVSRSAPPGVCHDWRPSASLKLALSELVLSPSLSLGKVQSLTLCRLPFR